MYIINLIRNSVRMNIRLSEVRREIEIMIQTDEI